MTKSEKMKFVSDMYDDALKINTAVWKYIKKCNTAMDNRITIERKSIEMMDAAIGQMAIELKRAMTAIEKENDQ